MSDFCLWGVENGENFCTVFNCFFICIFSNNFFWTVSVLERFDDLLDINCRYTIICRTSLYIFLCVIAQFKEISILPPTEGIGISWEVGGSMRSIEKVKEIYKA